MKLEDLLRGTPNESAPLKQPPLRVGADTGSRIDDIEAALCELAELIVGGEE